MTADLHPDTGLPRPGTCCGVCPPIAGGGWDCTCEGLAGCPKNEPGLAAGRAETTTATTERLRDAIERVPKVGPNAIYEAELLSVLREARDALLATARTRPTRDDLARAIASGYEPDHPTPNRHDYRAADAVLALLEGGDDQ